MLCVWWNTKGLLRLELLNPGQTVIAKPYSQQLGWMDQVQHRKEMNTVNTKFLNDSAWTHITKMAQQMIEELG